MMLRIPFAALIAFLFAGFMSAPLAQQQARAVAIDDDDIGGVVTSAERPGSRRLGRSPRRPACGRSSGRSSSPTTRAAIVVPDLPRGNYTLWVRGYGLTDSKPVAGRPGQQLNLQATIAADAAGRRGDLSRELLVFADQGAGEERVPGHGPEGQRHLAEHADAGRLDQRS